MNTKNTIVIASLVALIMLTGIAAATASTTTVSGCPAPVKIGWTGSDRLTQVQFLCVNQYLRSENQQFVLYMQNDGNLVAYWTKGFSNPATWKPIWSTTTKNGYGYYWAAEINAAGWFVIQKTGGTFYGIYTYSETNAGNFVVIQNDGNLVLYNQYKKPLWASNSHT